MTQPLDFKVAFLEKIAVPLLSSIMMSKSGASEEDAADNKPKSEAQNMAALLGTSIEFSAQLSDLLDLKNTGDNVESIRVALAAVAANLMADYQSVSGKIPDTTTFKRLLSAMETSLMFADHFTPDANHVARLSSIEPDEEFVMDEAQINIQYMNIMVPVVSVVADYTFGRDEKKLILEIAGKLSQAAEKTSRSLSGANDDALAVKRRELQIFKAAAALYTNCHREETARIMGMSDDARAQLSEQSGSVLSMDHLWANFSNRFAALGILAGMPEGKSPASAAPTTVHKVEVEEVPAPQIEAQQPAHVEVLPAEEPQPQAASQDDADDDDSGSPMSFFAKKRVSSSTDGENADGTMV